MIKPVLQGDAFLRDVDEAGRVPGRLALWWLGQSGFLVQWEGHHLLLDPYLSDSLTLKYAQTDKPHVRLTELVVDPGALNFLEAVTSSHNHTDHLDRDTLMPLLGANAGLPVVIPEANREFVAERLGISPSLPIGLDAGKSVGVGGFVMHGIPAAHNELERDGRGRYRFLGYVIEVGPWTIYHAGDTLRYEGMEDWLRPWKIDVALLPINGNKPERRVAGNLDGREAATLARDLGVGVVIPCHYEMFAFNTVSPDEFLRAAAALNQPFRILKAGERWTLSDQSSAG